MKSYRVFSIILLFVLVVNSFGPVISVKAQTQPLFEGMIAYVDSTGNIVIATGDGQQRRITSDANLDTISEKNTTYQDLNFSPNGAYLSFVRSGYEGESETFIYDVSKGSINKFELDNTFIQWHKDSDSLIVEYYHDVYNDSHTDYLTWREYFRQYLSGEKVLLFKLQKNNNGFVINFENNTVFYTPDNSPDGSGIIYNWADNIEYKVEHYGTGYWSPDGTSFVITDNFNYYFILGLKTGTLVKKTELLPPIEHTFPNGETYNLIAVSNDISPDSTRLLLSDDLHLYDFNLYTLNSETIYTSQHDSPDYRLYGNWSRSGDIMMFDEYSIDSSYYDDLSDDQSLFTLEKGSSPVFVANNAESLFWLSKNSERLLYKQYTKNGQKASVELMLFDYVNRVSVKIGDLPTITDVESTYDTPTDFIVAWTNGKVDLPVNPGTVPLVIVTPGMGVTPVSSDIFLQNYDEIFIQKQAEIDFLKKPSIDVKIDGIFLAPFSITQSNTWGYNEHGAQRVLSQLHTDYERYKRDQMSVDERAFFEQRMAAFNRLTYSEQALHRLFPIGSELAYDSAHNFSKVAVTSFTLIRSLEETRKILPPNSIIDKLLDNFRERSLKTIEFFIEQQIDEDNWLSAGLKSTLLFMVNAAQTGVLEAKLDVDNAIEYVVDELVTKAGTEFLMAEFIKSTQEAVNLSVSSVYRQDSPTGQFLDVRGSDLDAKNAIDILVSRTDSRKQQQLATSQAWATSAEVYRMWSSTTGLVGLVTTLNPATAPFGVILDLVSIIFGSSSQVINGYASANSFLHFGQTATTALVHAPRVAFDPAYLDQVDTAQYYTPTSQFAGIIPVVINPNSIPAPTFYSRNREMVFDSVDAYEQSIQNVLNILASNDENQIEIAVSNYIIASDNLSASVTISEQPLLSLPLGEPKAQSFLTATQGLRSADMNFMYALIVTIGARTTDPSVMQKLQESARRVVQSLGLFKTEYVSMSQMQMNLSVTPMLTIVNYEIAEQANVGQPLALKVFIANPGTLKSGDAHISIQGNDFIQGGVVQPINSIAPGQQSSVDVNLKPLQGGRTILAIEIVQDKKVVDAELIWVEIEKKSTILQSFGLSQNALFVLGGLGLLCLSAFVIGGVFIFTRSRKPKLASKSQPPQTPVSSSAERIKYAIQLGKSNRLQEAFDILREVVKSEPNNASAWLNLGSVLVHMENYRDAERCYSRARQLGHSKADEALTSLRQKRQ